ncbi:MAG: helix-turn-helix transcriptional regulator [Alkaliphilus sp.]
MHEKLRMLRKSSNYTQTEMALKLGIIKQTYSKIERGEIKINYHRAVLIAKILNTAPEKIFES